MTVTFPDVVHFYSYATGVSIELPVGFELIAEDDVSASYGDRADDGPVVATTPVVQVRVVGELDGDSGPAAVHALADGFAAAGEDTLARTTRDIDNCPAETVVSRLAGRVVQQTVVAADGRLLSIAAAAPTEEMLAAYDAALESIRIIAL